MNPTSFTPIAADDFIGPANKVAHLMANKVKKLKDEPTFFAAIYHGQPGTGKSALCYAFATWLTSHSIAIERVNGQSVSVDRVREWRDNLRMTSMFSDWRCIIIEEVDSASKQAMTEMLTLFDERPRNVAFLMTTNTDPEAELPERLQTRAFLYPVSRPTDPEIRVMLTKILGDCKMCDNIVRVANGNVRAALIEAEAELDRREL